MATNDEMMERLIDRAMGDPAFAQQFMADPVAAAQAAGLSLSAAELAAFMGQSAPSEGELVEELSSRISYGMVRRGSTFNP